MVLVTAGWGRTLGAYRGGSLEPIFTVELPREPRDVLVEGDRAFVSHVGGEVSVVALDNRGVRTLAAPRVEPRTKGVRDLASQGFSLARGSGDVAGRIFAPIAVASRSPTPAKSGACRWRISPSST